MTFFGLQLHPQYTTWDEMRDAALLAEQAGWDVLMTWDHFVPLMGDVTGPNLEGWQILAAFAAITKKPLIGMLVSGNTYRHPAVLANMATTLDNISNGYAERPRAATLDGSFLADVQGAIADLPPDVWRLFGRRLLGVYFVEDLGGTGYTDVVHDAAGNPVAG